MENIKQKTVGLTNITLLPAEYLGDPESVAMLQAFYSRSQMPIAERLNKLGGDMTSVKKALSSYYIGYGHRSIGQCGNVTLFIENVSMLAAKVFQHHPLYRGQETSSRYVDFTKNPVYALNDESKEVQLRWIQLVDNYTMRVAKGIRATYKPAEGETDANIERTCKAKAFDIMRGFLPIGACTSLSITMDMQSLNDHLNVLACSSNAEVSGVASTSLELLVEAYPSAFYRREPTAFTLQSSLSATPAKLDTGKDLQEEPDVTLYNFQEHLAVKSLNSLRQEKVSYSSGYSELDRYGRVRMELAIDFGSYRDIQRHRNMFHLLPTIGESSGRVIDVHPFYITNAISELNKLPVEEGKGTTYGESFYADYMELLADTSKLVQDSQLTLNPYVQPMGVYVECELDMGLHQALYLLELRSTPFVHPTLRKVMQQASTQLVDEVWRQSNGRILLNLHVKQDDDENHKRGNQTILDNAGNELE